MTYTRGRHTHGRKYTQRRHTYGGDIHMKGDTIQYMHGGDKYTERLTK